MRAIPSYKRAKVIKLLLEGHSYDDISRISGVSKGSIANIAMEIKECLPEYDELRDLSVRLRRQGMSVEDARKGVELLSRLESLGIGLEDLEDFIRLARKLQSEEYATREVLPKAIELLRLEDRLGRSCEEALKEVDEVTSKLEELKKEKEDVEGELSRLKEEARQLNDLFNAFRKLGINGERLEQLYELAKTLNQAGIDISRISNDAKVFLGLRNKADSLKKEIAELESQKRVLLNEIEKLGIVAKSKGISIAVEILKSKRTLISCINCNSPIPILLPSLSELSDYMRRGIFYQIRCHRCGFVNNITPQDVLASIGWRILQA